MQITPQELLEIIERASAPKDDPRCEKPVDFITDKWKESLEPAPTPAPQGDPRILVEALKYIETRQTNTGQCEARAAMALRFYREALPLENYLKSTPDSVPPPAPDAPGTERVRLLEELMHDAIRLCTRVRLWDNNPNATNYKDMTFDSVIAVESQYKELEALHAH